MADEPRNESQQPERPPEGEQQSQPEARQAPDAETPARPPEPESRPPAEAKPAKSSGRGCSLFAWIVVLAAILAVAAYLVHRAQVEEQKRLAEERAQRRAVRQSQIAAIGDDVAKALKVAQEGDIAKTLMILEAQESLLATIAREASASGDNDDAQQIVEYKAAVGQVADAIRQKEEELKTFAVQQISSLGTKFPQVQRAATSLQAPEQAKQKTKPQQGEQAQAGAGAKKQGKPSQQGQPSAEEQASPAQQEQSTPQTQPVGPGP